MTIAGQDVVRGAAVVIDDRIGQESDIEEILDQLKRALIPTVKLQKLPPLDALVHWKQLALIVMDWNLTDPGGEPEISMPAGITTPSEKSREMVEENTAFISALLKETALPIFVATNDSIDTVNSDLAAALGEAFPSYAERVHVFTKGELRPDLFGKIDEWLAARPALRVLEAWRRAYVDAEIDVFQQFAEAQHDWVASIQRAAEADPSDVGTMLRDLIAANIVNRIGPLTVALDAVEVDGAVLDGDALRRVMHYCAVVPDSSLEVSEVGTGDMFVDVNASEPYTHIKILLTPECDLTARDPKWRFTTLTAERNPRTSKISKNRASGAWKFSKELCLTVNLLTADCVEYDIAVNEWISETVTPDRSADPITIWPGHKRIGRLLDPYSTFLQQNFALVATRKGMPRLPADLYAIAVAEAETSRN